MNASFFTMMTIHVKLERIHDDVAFEQERCNAAKNRHISISFKQFYNKINCDNRQHSRRCILLVDDGELVLEHA